MGKWKFAKTMEKMGLQGRPGGVTGWEGLQWCCGGIIFKLTRRRKV